jgi:hypothetical protein
MVALHAPFGIQPALQPQVASLLRLLALLLLEGALAVFGLLIQPVMSGLNLRVRPWRRHPLLYRLNCWRVLLREADDVGGTNAGGDDNRDSHMGDSDHWAASSCSTASPSASRRFPPFWF